MRRLPSLLALLALGGCSGQGPTGTSTPTALPSAAVQTSLDRASGALASGLRVFGAAVQSLCDPASSTAALDGCQRALGEERAARITFDSALRQLRLPPSLASDAASMLDADDQLEALLEQAATSPSLRVIQLLDSQLAVQRAAIDASITKLRVDAGLPPAPVAP